MKLSANNKSCQTSELYEVIGDDRDVAVAANSSVTGTIPAAHKAREIQFIPRRFQKYDVIITMANGDTTQAGTWGQYLDRQFQKCESYIVSYEIIELGGADNDFIINWVSRNENTND